MKKVIIPKMFFQKPKFFIIWLLLTLLIAVISEEVHISYMCESNEDIQQSYTTGCISCLFTLLSQLTIIHSVCSQGDFEDGNVIFTGADTVPPMG